MYYYHFYWTNEGPNNVSHHLSLITCHKDSSEEELSKSSISRFWLPLPLPCCALGAGPFLGCFFFATAVFLGRICLPFLVLLSFAMMRYCVCVDVYRIYVGVYGICGVDSPDLFGIVFPGPSHSLIVILLDYYIYLGSSIILCNMHHI